MKRFMILAAILLSTEILVPPQDQGYNPLAPLNFQNYYDPSLYSVPNVNGNTFFPRGIIVPGRQIIRVTLPVSTVLAGRSSIDLPGGRSKYFSSRSDRHLLVRSWRCEHLRFDPGDEAGRGHYVCDRPQFVAPSAANSSLGAGKWQAGPPHSLQLFFGLNLQWKKRAA